MTCRYRLILALLLLSASLFAPVRPSVAGSEPDSSFTVTAILPLSGPFAEYGTAARNGIELARKNNSALANHIRFLFEDSLYSGPATITAFHRAAEADQVDLVFVWGHGPSQAVASVAESSRHPAVVVSGQRDVADGKQYVIRYCSPHSEFATKLLQELRRTEHKKAAVVQTEVGYIHDTVAALAATIAQPESLEVIETFQPGATDFQSTVSKLKTKNFDLLGLFLTEDQIPLFLSRMAAAKFTAPIFGTHSLGGKRSIEVLQASSPEAFFAANYVDKDFHLQYSAEYGNDIQITWAANAYDFANLLEKLFGGKPRRNAEEIVRTIQSVQDERGVTGRYRFQSDASHGTGFVFPVVIKTISKTGISEAEPD